GQGPPRRAARAPRGDPPRAAASPLPRVRRRRRARRRPLRVGPGGPRVISPPTAQPKLGARTRTDPALTYAKLADVLSAHCGIVLNVQRLRADDRTFGTVHGYYAHVEGATMVGRRATEGRAGSRFAFDKDRAFVRTVGE